MFTNVQNISGADKGSKDSVVNPPPKTLQEIDQLFFDKKIQLAADEYKIRWGKNLKNHMLLLRRVAALLALNNTQENLKAALKEINLFLAMVKMDNDLSKEIIVEQVAWLIEMELNLDEAAIARHERLEKIGIYFSDLNIDRFPLQKYLKIMVAKALSADFPCDALLWLSNANEQILEDEVYNKNKPNNIEINYLMALHLSAGHGIEKDEEKAFKILEELARFGYRPAMMLLAVRYYLPRSDSLADFILLENFAKQLGKKSDDLIIRGIELLKEAANKGLAPAQLLLSQIFLKKSIHGFIIPEKLITPSGKFWLMRAVAQKYNYAILDLAKHYVEGEIFPQNVVKAYHFYKQLAAEKDVDAQYLIATLYLIIKSSRIKIEGKINEVAKNIEVQQDIARLTPKQIITYINNAIVGKIYGAKNLLTEIHDQLDTATNLEKQEKILYDDSTLIPPKNVKWKVAAPSLDLTNEEIPIEELQNRLKKACNKYFNLNYNSAAKIFKTCFDTNNDPVAFFGYAACLLMQKKTLETIAAIDAALLKKYIPESRIFKTILLKLKLYIEIDLKNNTSIPNDIIKLEQACAITREKLLQLYPQFIFDDMLQPHLFVHLTIAELFSSYSIYGNRNKELSQKWLALGMEPKNQSNDAKLLWVSQNLEDSKHSSEAIEMLKVCSRPDNPKFQYLHALCLLATKKNELEKEAVKILDLLSTAGLADAQFTLGNIYSKGELVKTNKQLGFSLIKKAAEQKYALAEFMLASIYAHQHNKELDAISIFRLIESAAAGESSDAQCTLGLLLLSVNAHTKLPIIPDCNEEALNVIKTANILIKEPKIKEVLLQYNSDKVKEEILALFTKACKTPEIAKLAMLLLVHASTDFISSLYLNSDPQPDAKSAPNTIPATEEAKPGASAAEPSKKKKKNKKKKSTKGVLTLPKVKSEPQAENSTALPPKLSDRSLTANPQKKQEANSKVANRTPQPTSVGSSERKKIPSQQPIYKYDEIRKKEKEDLIAKKIAQLEKRKLKFQERKLKAKASAQSDVGVEENDAKFSIIITKPPENIKATNAKDASESNVVIPSANITNALGNVKSSSSESIKKSEPNSMSYSSTAPDFKIAAPQPIKSHHIELTHLIEKESSENIINSPPITFTEKLLRLKTNLKEKNDFTAVANEWKNLFSEGNIYENFNILLDSKLSQPALAEFFIPELDVIWKNVNDKTLKWFTLQLQYIATDSLPNKYNRMANLLMAIHAYLNKTGSIAHDSLIYDSMMTSKVSKLFGVAKNNQDEVPYNEFFNVRQYTRSLHTYLQSMTVAPVSTVYFATTGTTFFQPPTMHSSASVPCDQALSYRK